MPFVSQAQRRLFYARPELRKYIKEFEAATPKEKKLPEHVQKQRHKRRDRRAALLERMKQGR